MTNLVCLPPGDLGIGPGTKVGQVLNISFDMGESSRGRVIRSDGLGDLALTALHAAAWETLGCLCNGGTLVLRGSDWEPTLREVRFLLLRRRLPAPPPGTAATHRLTGRLSRLMS